MWRIATFSEESNQNIIHEPNLEIKMVWKIFETILENCIKGMYNKNSPWRKGLVRSDPSSNMRLPKTWSDRDKGKRGTWAVVEPTTKRHWPCRTKCLTATTASHYLRGVCAHRPLLLAARGLYKPVLFSLSSAVFFIFSSRIRKTRNIR